MSVPSVGVSHCATECVLEMLSPTARRGHLIVGEGLVNIRHISEDSTRDERMYSFECSVILCWTLIPGDIDPTPSRESVMRV